MSITFYETIGSGIKCRLIQSMVMSLLQNPTDMHLRSWLEYGMQTDVVETNITLFLSLFLFLIDWAKPVLTILSKKLDPHLLDRRTKVLRLVTLEVCVPWITASDCRFLYDRRHKCNCILKLYTENCLLLSINATKPSFKFAICVPLLKPVAETAVKAFRI